MTTLREAAQQALEALEMSRRFVYADNRPQCDDAIAALRAALAQEQAEPCPNCASLEAQNAELDRKLAEMEQADLSRCPQCGGIADNGHDRSIPPNPYFCSKCMDEPVAGIIESQINGDSHQTLDDVMRLPRAMAQAYENGYKVGQVHEREACAKLAESTVCDTHLPTGVRIYGTRAADAIRARGAAEIGRQMP